MKYQIEGGSFPVAICELNRGESVCCQAGGMAWMDQGIHMETKGGGIGKLFGRALSGESLFLNHYVADAPGKIAFAASAPGRILPVTIAPGRSIIAQKGSYLASDEGVEMSVFFQKKIGAAVFGGEGFIMQKFTGSGTVLVEVDGSAIAYDLAPGQQMTIDTGYLVMMEDTCKIDIVTVKGVKNVLFGGEGLFNTVITGPGKIVLQTMPLTSLAGRIAAMVSSGN